jgi:Rrf2 family protein
MRVTAKSDYAVRAMLELARVHPAALKGDEVASRQGTPLKFTEHILADMRRAGFVGSRRGSEGGYRLIVEPGRVTVADIVRAVEGPIADVRGIPPEQLDYADDTEPLQRTWIAARANLRAVLESVTLAGLVSGALPPHVTALADDPDAWSRRVGPT